ncbi:MAG: Uma2 family endonuclease [Thermomicrobiales bacterium]|nr:Uma2 family endonuclease [Thermomicrobiales bacterium]MCO5220842.1 Uma2 family endonuclease [Thermomicrobiales bacterium]
MVTTRTITAAELLVMGSDVPYELIQGELVSVSPSSIKSNMILSNIHGAIFAFVRSRKLGLLSVGEGGYLLESNPDTVVAPDIGFVVRDRLPDPIPARGYLPVRPDLIVEVISPTDERSEIERKQALYDRIEVPVVWWIDPRRETASVHVPGQPVQVIDRTGQLDGGDLLPGFTLKLAEIFDEL